MKREDLDVDDEDDRERASKPYFTAAQLLDLQKEKTLVMQCYWRAYVARRRATSVRRRLYEKKVAEDEAAQEAAAQEVRRNKHEVERRVNPRTRRDFELLYNELEAWRAKEVDRITELDATPDEKKRAMSDILSKETKALQTIDRLKSQAAKDGRSRRIEHVMDLMAQPKRWQVGDGEIQQVHTPFTTRATELRDLYLGLASPSPVVDERLQMLLNVKWTVSSAGREPLQRARAGPGICLSAHARHRRPVRPRSRPPRPRPPRALPRGLAPQAVEFGAPGVADWRPVVTHARPLRSSFSLSRRATSIQRPDDSSRSRTCGKAIRRRCTDISSSSGFFGQRGGLFSPYPFGVGRACRGENKTNEGGVSSSFLGVSETTENCSDIIDRCFRNQ